MLKEEVFTIHENKNLSRSFEQIVSGNKELILDARPKGVFESKNENGEFNHIPGSINIPYDGLFDEETGLFKTKEQLLKSKLIFFVYIYKY